MFRMTEIALLAIALSSVVSVTAAAQDQETGAIELDPGRGPALHTTTHHTAPVHARSLREPGPLRFYGGFNVAVGGHLQHEQRVRPYATYSDDRADPTVGFQLGGDYVLMDYFSIGGEMRFLWAK